MDGFTRIVEEKILEAQKAGMFDNLPGKGKPLRLEDQTWVPEELRVAYHVLKNARVLPPEAELLKEIHTLEDLMKYVEDQGERKAFNGKSPASISSSAAHSPCNPSATTERSSSTAFPADNGCDAMTPPSSLTVAGSPHPSSLILSISFALPPDPQIA